MIWPTEEDITLLHDLAISETGGSFGQRDAGLPETAVFAPLQSFGGEDLYQTVEEKIARLSYGIVDNHAYIDGNKRTAALVMEVYLRGNGISIVFNHGELAEIFIALANKSASYEDLLIWINSHKA